MIIFLSEDRFNHNKYFIIIHGVLLGILDWFFNWDKEFKKEQLKVQADTERKLRISGERPVEGNQWRRFLKSFQLPKDCNAKLIKAKIEEGILYVVVPRPMAEDHHPSQQSKEQAYKEQDVDETRQGPEWSRKWILNVLVAIIVVAGLGAYVVYKLSHKRDS